FSSANETEMSSFQFEAFRVPITFSSPRSPEALLDFMVATIKAKDMRTCSTLVICQQKAEVHHVESELGKRKINTMLLETDHITVHHIVPLWAQRYIQHVLIACDDNLMVLEGVPVNFVIHTALPPVEKFKDRLSILTKSKINAEMLAFILDDPEEEIRSLQSEPEKENGKTPKLVVKLFNKRLEQETSDIAHGTRALNPENRWPKDVSAMVPQESEIEGWETPPETQAVHFEHAESIQRQMELISEASSRLGKASPPEESIKDKRSPTAAEIASERDGMTRAQFGVLVWSRDVIVPCYDISGVDLNPSIRDTMTAMMGDMRDRQARGIQRYAWPHVSCGKSLVAVGPERIGKTWCFLPSLCQRTYEQMLLCSKKAYGPTSIVVSLNKQQGNQILHWIIKLLDPLTTAGCICFEQVVTLWEKGNVQEVADRLSRSVGILVTTPEMLVLLKKLHTRETPIFDANSVKCLVLDNLSDMMRHLPDTTAKMVDWIIQFLNFGAKGCQLFITTRLWPETLMRKSLLPLVPDVLIVFKDPLEATIYGRASLEVNVITPGEESRAVVQMLQNRSLNEDRIVVMCQTKEEVLDLKYKLTKAGIQAQGIYSDSGLLMISQWRQKRLAFVLLITDDMVNKMKCGPIDQIIHYTPAISWMRFKFRFSMFYSNYVSSVEGPGKSVVLLQRNNFERIWLLADFIIWHQLPRPDHCLRVLAENRQMKDKPSSELAKLSLCEQIATYGNCFRWSCRYRHVMWKEEVQPPANYPTEGDFCFQVLTCNSPAHIAVRLNELYPTKIAFLNTPMTQLCHEIHVYYELEQNRRQHTKPKVGEIVIVRNLKRYERVVITGTDINKITVRLLDTGIEVLTYKPSQIFICKERHQNKPYQAMEVRLIGIEPNTIDRIWTKDMRDVVRCCFFSRLQEQHKRIFSARVKFVLSRTIFVETVVDDNGQDLRSFLLDRFRVREEAMSMEKLMNIVDESQPTPKD
ncbi:hypothetical protein KR200_004770, partial [Drosophila serrata]